MKNNLAALTILHVAFVTKCEKQRVVKLLTCDFHCQTNLDSVVFLVMKGLLCNLGSLSQELQLLEFDWPKTGHGQIKTCLTGQCDQFLPVSYLQPSRGYYNFVNHLLVTSSVRRVNK